MSALWVVIMAVGLVGMIICSKKQRSNPALQPVSFLLFIVVLIGAFMWLRSSDIIGSGGTSGIVGNEMAYQRSRGTVAGEFMAKAAPGKKILVIADPNFDKDQFVMGMMDAFKKAYGSDDMEMDTIDVPPNVEEDGTPISELMTNKALDGVIAKHPGAELIIFVGGLPENPNRMKIFSGSNRPVVFLFNRGGATGKFLTEQIKSGNIAGVIVGKSGVKYSTKAPSKVHDAFDIRYILVNKDNLDANKDRLD